MKQGTAVLVMSLFIATISAAQRNTDAPEIIYRTIYEAEWDLVWYEKFLGSIAGLLPSQFELTETRWRSGRREEFFIELKDDDGKVWAQFHSDTARYRSAVWLPRKPKKTLGNGAVRFIHECQRLFADEKRDALYGTFSFGGHLLAAHAFRLPQGKSPNITRFAVQAVDSSGKTEVEGFVEISKNPHPFHYPFISVHLVEDNINLTLREIKKP